MLPVAIAWSFSDVCAVLCTSSFVDDVVERMDQNEIWRIFSSSLGNSTGGKVAVYD